MLLDVSKSMGFGSAGVTKLDYGRMLAGCLTYLVHRQRDRVGLVAFDNDIVEFVPPSAKHMDVALHVLDRLKPANPGSLRVPMNKIAEHFGRRGMLVLISDLYEEPDAVLEAIGPLRFRGHDMIVFHLLDRRRARFRVRGSVGVRGSRERRADSDRPGGAGVAVPRARPGAHHRADRAVLGQPHRLQPGQHVRAARPRAVHVSEHARAADRNPVDGA